MSRPSFITAMRSATIIASSWSWVTMTKVVPSRRCKAISSNWVSPRSFLSSAAIGSSSSSTRGRLISARASATRWRWPPESSADAAVAEALQLHQRQHLLDALGDLAPPDPVLAQAEADIARDIEMREQRVVLEHHVDRPAVRRHGADVLAVEQDAAGAQLLEAGEQAQQRGLAAAGGAEQREELALPDVEGEVFDRADRAEALGHALEAHQRGRPPAGAASRPSRPLVHRPEAHVRIPQARDPVARAVGKINGSR